MKVEIMKKKSKSAGERLKKLQDKVLKRIRKEKFSVKYRRT